MEINISTRHGHISEETQAKIVAKVEKLTRVFDRLTAIEVTIDLEHRETPRIDLLASAEHKHDFVATDQSEDLLATADAVVRKIDQQLRRYKEKIQDRHRAGTVHSEAVPSQPRPAVE